MRVLVTGGGGFLGSHLVTELLKEENSVIVVDNFYTGKKSNLDHVLSNKNLEIIRHDVTEAFSFEVDYIFNLANKGFNLYVGENNKALGNFEHSGLFALIDKNGMIRCRKDKQGNPILYYDGLEAKGVKEIQEDIKLLLNE